MKRHIDGIVFAGYNAIVDILNKYKRSEVINDIVSTAMLSFGEVIGGDLTKAKTRAVDRYKKFIDKGYNKQLLFDSGGFQILMGYVPKDKVPELIDQYIEFIKATYNDKNFYMTVDVMVNNSTIPDTQTSYELSAYGLKKMFELPEEIRNSIYMVYQFTSPSMLEVWNKLLCNLDISKNLGSHKWAAGGLAANYEKRKTGSIITYIYALTDALFNNDIEYVKNGASFSFHTLGINSPIENLTGYLIKNLLREYGYEMHYSYDSTTIIQSIVRANTMILLKNDYIYQVKFNYKNKDKTTSNLQSTNEQTVVAVLDKLMDELKLDMPDTWPSLYDDQGRIDKQVMEYLVLAQAQQMLKIDKFMDSNCKELIHYLSHDIVTFHNALVDLIAKMKGGIISKNTLKLINSIVASVLLVDDYINGTKFNHDELMNELHDLFAKFGNFTELGNNEAF